MSSAASATRNSTTARALAYPSALYRKPTVYSHSGYVNVDPSGYPKSTEAPSPTDALPLAVEAATAAWVKY
jgi:hypothetical protein